MSLSGPLFTGILFALTSTPALAFDQDGDGVDDNLDNCIQAANPGQQDTNGDGFGNACDADFNGNNIVDPADFSLLKSVIGSPSAPDQDLNSNGIVDPADFSLTKSLLGLPPGPSCTGLFLGCVAPLAPVLSAIGAQSVNAGNTLSFNVSASDSDGTTPLLGATGLPSGATFVDNNNGTGSFSWPTTTSDTGTYNITFTASDASDAALTDTETITVSVIDATQELRPYGANKSYWQYKGAPVLLLGAFEGAHNVFLYPDQPNLSGDLTALMDEMTGSGGNVMRCVVDAGRAVRDGFQAPHQKIGGSFDLDLFTSGVNSFWGKFITFLDEAVARDIVVQIELWSPHDWEDSEWDNSPWNPANNSSYTTSSSGLATSYSSYTNHPFGQGVPGHSVYDSASSSRKAQYDLVRGFQEKYIQHMLSISLSYSNVLYTINNETPEQTAWGAHWMAFIETEAALRNKQVYVTDMFDNGWDLQNSNEYVEVFADPATYTFIDISQNNGMMNLGGPEGHWDNLLYARSMTASSVRPINNTKMYGADTFSPSSFHLSAYRRYGDLAAQNSFWMNLIGGAASARFHRPSAGQGLSTLAKASLMAARKLETKVKLWQVAADNSLLSQRGTFTVSVPGLNFSREPFVYGEAYLAAEPGEQYALYFTRGGSVDLDLSAFSAANFDLTWINIDTGEWGASATITGGAKVSIDAPSNGAWVAAIVR